MMKRIMTLGASAAALAATVLLAAPAASAAPGEPENVSEAHRRRDNRVIISCGSGDYDPVRCVVPRDADVDEVRLVNQRSRADCEEGRSWGFERNYIWVRAGCRADFELVSFRDRRGHDDDLDGGWRDERHAVSQAVQGCSRAAIDQVWRQGGWSVQYAGEPRFEFGRRGIEVTGDMRVHDSRGFQIVRTSCQFDGRSVTRFSMR